MKYLLLLFTILLSFAVTGKPLEDDYTKITHTLQNYITGTSYNEPDLIKRAFAKEARLLLSKEGQDTWFVDPKEYSSWFKNKGQFNGRVGEILSIDVVGDIATAKVEILIPKKSIRYVDLFLLKQLSDGWKVVSKAATSETVKLSGERILFIVSNAHFHGDSKLPTGVSFSEIVKAYDTFKKVSGILTRIQMEDLNMLKNKLNNINDIPRDSIEFLAINGLMNIGILDQPLTFDMTKISPSLSYTPNNNAHTLLKYGF